MLPLDAKELYDLSEAGRLLFADPVRLRRLGRLGRVPLTEGPAGAALPAAWVDAEAGRTPADAEGLKRYWLERLAPAAPEAGRPLRDRHQLPSETLLDAEEAARAVWAEVEHLRRLDADGTLPALRVDGATRYDAELVSLIAEEDLGNEEAARAAVLRRRKVRDWTRYEYVTGLTAGAAPPPATTRPAPAEALAAAPRAWHMPDDIADMADGEETASTDDASPEARDRGVIEADGFEVEEEDP